MNRSLRDCGLHLCDGSRGIGRDVARYAVAAVHDEGAFVHAGLGGGYEVFVGDSAGPSGVDVCVWVED